MKKLFVGILVSLCVFFSATPLMAAMPFNDVKTSDWFYDSVNYAYNNNLFEGTSLNTFSPNAGMTRGMFVTVLGRLEGIDPTQYTNVHFSDTALGMWYTPYVQWAYNNGITNGITENTFGVDNQVTREQMAKLLLNYMNYKGIYLQEVTAAYDFEDQYDISGYAQYAVQRCQQYGLLTGKTCNQFDPKGNSTRAEVATVFKRLSASMAGERIILNYMGSKVPTYDSVTLQFCYICGYSFSDDVNMYGYWPWADLFVYEYSSSALSAYDEYLLSHGFTLTVSGIADGTAYSLYSSASDRVLIAEMEVSGDNYIMILLPKYDAF